MSAPRLDTVRDWQGRTMVDPAGGKLGTITDIYLDDETGQPEWATVTTGLFGTKATFVALAQAQATGDSVQVPYDQDQVKDAPTCSPTASCRRTTRPSCTATMVKTALTGAALAAMAWSRALRAMLDEAGEVPVQGGTDPSADTPEDVAKAQRQLKLLQWVIPV